MHDSRSPSVTPFEPNPAQSDVLDTMEDTQLSTPAPGPSNDELGTQDRLTWNEDKRLDFLACCVADLREYNVLSQPRTGLKNEGFARIMDAMRAKYPDQPFTISKIQAYYKKQKRRYSDWLAWKDLSGTGFKANGVADGSGDQKAAFLRTHSDASWLFREPLTGLEMLEERFPRHRPTGRHIATPRSLVEAAETRSRSSEAPSLVSTPSPVPDGLRETYGGVDSSGEWEPSRKRRGGNGDFDRLAEAVRDSSDPPGFAIMRSAREFFRKRYGERYTGDIRVYIERKLQDPSEADIFLNSRNEAREALLHEWAGWAGWTSEVEE